MFKITLKQKIYLQHFAVFLLSFPSGALTSYLYSCAADKCDSVQLYSAFWYLIPAIVGIILFLKVDKVVTREEEVYQMHLDRENAAHKEEMAFSAAIVKAIEDGDLNKVKELDELR